MGPVSEDLRATMEPKVEVVNREQACEVSKECIQNKTKQIFMLPAYLMSLRNM